MKVVASSITNNRNFISKEKKCCVFFCLFCFLNQQDLLSLSQNANRLVALEGPKPFQSLLHSCYHLSHTALMRLCLSTVRALPHFCICKKALFKKRQIFAWLCLKLGVSHAAIKGNGNYSQVYIYHINKWNIDCEGRTDSPLSIA